MQYLGGKTKLAKTLVQKMREIVGDIPCWEPFCGGLSVSCELAKRAEVACSDAHSPLIALYSAMQTGWVPPDTLSEEDYTRAKTLPDSDPLKAFAGFGCSFSGKWFGGAARPLNQYCATSKRSLQKQLPNPRLEFRCMSFFDVLPQPLEGFIYCDPPYKGTTGYGMSWDPDAFWTRVREWAVFCPIFISEFSAPDDTPCVLEIPRKKTTGFTRESCVDRLYVLGVS